MSGLSPSAMSQLQQGLASQSAPPNPATAKDRTDPAESKLLDLQRIRRSIEVAKKNLDDAAPELLMLSAMHGAASRMLTGGELSDAADALLEGVFPLASAALKQRLQTMFSPPIGLGGGAAPGKPPGMLGAQPPAMAGSGPNLAPPGSQPGAPAGPGVPAGGAPMGVPAA